MKHAALLKKVQDEAGNLDMRWGTQKTLGAFAKLLCALATDAEESARANENLQKTIRDYTDILIRLTVVLLLIGLAQIGVTIWAVNSQRNSQGTDPVTQSEQPKNH